jgi:LacI family transcriptional regulator
VKQESVVGSQRRVVERDEVKAVNGKGQYDCFSPEIEQVNARRPGRPSVVCATATALKEWISAGDLEGMLPGELQLKTQLGVGRDTLRLALKMLVKEGWIAPALKGRRRQIQINPASPRNDAKPSVPDVVVLLPAAEFYSSVEWRDTQKHLAEQGRTLKFITARMPRFRDPARQLGRIVRKYSPAVWILSSATEEVQRWFARHLVPTLLYGQPFPGVDLPFVTSDWETAAFEAGSQLALKGHQIIGLLESQKHCPGFLGRESGLKRALTADGRKAQFVVLRDGGSSPSVAHSLESVFRLKTRPTALILTRPSQLLTCYSWLASQGIRVPEDVSIISLASAKWFKDLHPCVCHYRPDFERLSSSLTQRILELATTRRTNLTSLKVPLEYVPGATVGSISCTDLKFKSVPGSEEPGGYSA